MTRQRKPSAHSVANDTLRTPVRDKGWRGQHGPTIQGNAASRHLQWCRHRRSQFRDRLRKGLAPPKLSVLRRYQLLWANVKARVAEGRSQLSALEDRFVRDKSPMVRAVIGMASGLAAPQAQKAEAAMQARLWHVMRERFQPVWSLYDQINRVWMLKCPVCGAHTIWRLCRYQTLRLFLINLRECVGILRHCRPQDKDALIQVAASLYGWNKFGADQDEVRRDIIRLVTTLVDMPILRLQATVRAVVRLHDELAYVLNGNKPKRNDPVEEAIKEQSQLMGLTAPELVWNAWYALSRLAFGIRTIPIRYMCVEDVREAVTLVGSLQRSYFSLIGKEWALAAVDVVESAFLRNLGEWLPLMVVREIGAFQRLEEAHAAEMRQREPPKVVLPSWFKPTKTKPIYRDAVVKPRFARALDPAPTLVGESSGLSHTPVGMVIGQNARNPGFSLQSLPSVVPEGEGGPGTADNLSEVAADAFGRPGTAGSDSFHLDVPQAISTQLIEDNTLVESKLSDEQGALLAKAQDSDCQQQ